jgi:glucosamine 6-phosphate synthetase-like amidotransferase/phosphosugar isomerase protein
MCGIIGCSRASKTSIPNGRKFMRTALNTIEDRGRQATGVGWAEYGDPINVWYSTLEGPASKVGHRLAMPKKGMHTMIGHTRHATLGKSSDHNNRHPVVADNIVLVHNGRCDNHKDLLSLANVKNPGLVDSFALPALLSKQEELGADHATDLLELVEGVAALAWMDTSENGVLHLARLAQRPLTIGWTKRGDLVFGSTREALRRTARLAGVKINEIESLDEGVYMRVEAGEVTDFRCFKVNHPKVVVAEDKPGMKKSKLAVVPAFNGADFDWWDEYDRHEAERLERQAENGRVFDLAMDQIDEHEIDWDNLIPRRGWK